ncbi:MAG: hypothetical protein LBI72_07065 [Flavobacteriaceae bacterium]|jgi:hypothetical protein|nr:hypothetical protein [Flavobacteriaceae bacterium]
MVSKYGKQKIIGLFLIAFLLSCETKNEYPKNEITIDVPLKSGDIVLRKGKGYFSDIFKQMGSREKRFSHIGILSKENDSIMVYHIEADEFTGEGYALREDLMSFVRNSEEYSFFENTMDSLSNHAMLSKAKSYFNLKVKFDLSFNVEDDDKLYCSELVAKCINYGLDSEYIKPTLMFNGRVFYGLDDIYLKGIFKEIK